MKFRVLTSLNDSPPVAYSRMTGGSKQPNGVSTMYAITGITGKVGGAAARALLAADQPVRAVLRNRDKAKYWASLGCEVILAEMEDAQALTAAFRGARGVFILPPSNFDPKPGFPEFEGGSATRVQGSVSLNDVLGMLVAEANTTLCQAS